MKQYRVEWAVPRPDDYLVAERYEIETDGTLTFYGCPGTTYIIQYAAGHWKNVQETSSEV